MNYYMKSLENDTGIYSLAFDSAVFDELCTRNCGIMQVYNSMVRLIIDGDCIERSITREEYELLCDMDNYSVVEINKGILEILYRNDSDDNYLIFTSHCNSNCIMCPSSDLSRQKSNDPSTDWLVQLINQIPISVRHLTITGGEPTLLAKEFIQLLKVLKNRFNNTEFLLLTNGRTFSDTRFFAEFMNNAPAKIQVAIPVYGGNAKSHDSITRANGSFDQTMCGIKHLLHQRFAVEIRIVVSKLNYRSINETAEYIIRNLKGIKCVNFIGVEASGNAAKYFDYVWIDYDIAFSSIKSSCIKLIQNAIDVGIYNFPLCMVERDYWPICKQSISDYKVNYYPECNGCQVKAECGGIFESTKRFAKPRVKPVDGGKDD
jgi:His-Xaa-Ser repeat-associated downstream radical SAM protein